MFFYFKISDNSIRQQNVLGSRHVEKFFSQFQLWIEFSSKTKSHALNINKWLELEKVLIQVITYCSHVTVVLFTTELIHIKWLATPCRNFSPCRSNLDRVGKFFPQVEKTAEKTGKKRKRKNRGGKNGKNWKKLKKSFKTLSKF